ncbi:uncharacterized protein LMH87_007596 [Akanthomyces muscarius]|uniref:Uncharacterized protein n=1 Tax=Akanthomyces muscarius TaxID=2231603 RepID=A0A9W8QKH0_AKAMU|nr:uncharacterized protein LMH87_007596 [Akanthomyces muscarius]KAJ4161564.1 hypothetical protein LMH87_007596 [Akanthomyces muscarius]
MRLRTEQSEDYRQQPALRMDDSGVTKTTYVLSYFLSILLMVFIVSIDATALAVVIPTITEEFDGTYL